MKKKIIGFLVVLMLIIPIQLALGASQSIIIMNNIDSRETSFAIDFVEMVNKVNKTMISYYLEPLVDIGTRFTGSKTCKTAAEFIYNRFKELELDVYIDPWRYLRYKCQNVVATLNGTDPSSDAIFLLCAHYDTIGDSPGANDDGSGIAAMLSIANITSKYSFNHTIRFLATSGEEVGLYGSHDYARKLYERDENIVAVLNIDTIGNTTKKGDNVVYLLKPDRSEWISSLIKETSQTYKVNIGLTVLHVDNRGNDHQSFLNYGYDAVQFVQLARGNYPMHTPQDTIEKINYTYLIKVTKLILASTIELASKPIDVQVRIVTPKEGYLYLFDRPIFRQPKINIFGKKARGMTYVLGRTTARINITTKEEINSVSFCIDGISSFPGFLQELPYEWKIKISSKIFPLMGKHKLGVYVSTSSGKTAYDEMDIFVCTLY